MTGPDYDGAYDPDADFDSWYTRATAAAIARRLVPGRRVLEFGCATGLMTASLVEAGADLVGVDRSEVYLARARARGLEGVRFVHGNVEMYDEGLEFDDVVATNLIHELPDPQRFLRRCREQLKSGGHLHLTLQNPYSIHRLVALELGLIRDLREISSRGQRYATLQLYDAEQLTAMSVEAGLTPVDREGVMLKPLSNDQMATLPDLVLEGFVAVARHFPQHCAMNYLVFRR